MSEHPIIEWYTKDKKLADLLVSIDQETLDGKAFYEVADLYELPKFPEDVIDDLYRYDTFDQRARHTSVFEQLAIHKIIAPESDIRGAVLAACMAVHKRIYYSIEEAAAEYFGTYDDIPEKYHVYFIGNDIDVKLKFSTSFKVKLREKARLTQEHFKEV